MQPDVPGPDTRGTRLRAVARNPDVRVAGAALLLLSLLTALSLHGSSLAALSPDGSPDKDSLIVGSPRPIRSDEYLVWSPIKLGQVYSGFADQRIFGMGVVDVRDSWRHHLPSRSLGHAIFSPFNTPLLVLPPAQGLAAYWWLPFFGAFLAVFYWLRRLGSGWPVALPASLLVVTAPAATWWSGWYLHGIAHSAGACALLMAGVDNWKQQRVKAVALTIGAVVVVAGLPWNYQPWAIPPALFTGVVTLSWGLASGERRRSFLTVTGIFLTFFAVASAAFLIREYPYFEALSQTVYPGSRRELGGGLRMGTLFSSLFGASVNGVDGSRIQGTNLSELSMGWTITLPISIGIAALTRAALHRDRDRTVILTTLVSGSLLASWTVIQWPGILAKVTLLEFVPPARMAPHVGFFGVIGLALLGGNAGRWQRIQESLDRTAVASLVLLAVGLAAWAATEFRTLHLPDLSWRATVAVYLVVGLLTLLVTSGRFVLALSLLAIISLAISAFVNPVMRGIGAIRDSTASHELRRIDEQVVGPVSGTWAADDIMLVPLLNGNGLHALSSFNDPVSRDGWLRLDPHGRYEHSWNRFSYILFSWEPGRESPEIEAVQADVVVIRADPCDTAFDALQLRAILASSPISGACLQYESAITWQGATRTVWSRRPIG